MEPPLYLMLDEPSWWWANGRTVLFATFSLGILWLLVWGSRGKRRVGRWGIRVLSIFALGGFIGVGVHRGRTAQKLMAQWWSDPNGTIEVRQGDGERIVRIRTKGRHLDLKWEQTMRLTAWRYSQDSRAED